MKKEIKIIENVIYNEKNNEQKELDISWQEEHQTIMKNFLSFINNQSKNFILKGGTALLFCYNLNRFSEDIDLNYYIDKEKPQKKDFFKLVEMFCKINNLTFFKKKDTETTKRAMIHYNNTDHPLKIEVSYRKKYDQQLFVNINGIITYPIKDLFFQKLNAYNGRNALRDLFDVVFIGNNYKEELNLSSAEENILFEIFQYKGYRYVEYILNDQHDDLINNDKLLEEFFNFAEYYNVGDDSDNEDFQDDKDSSESEITPVN